MAILLDRRRAALAGLLATATTLAWQALVVRCTLAGNWTAWFCTGSNLAQAHLPEAENLYVSAGTGGYDSQFYHYIAHDPLFHKGLDGYIDAPRLRYRRILVPGLAFLLAGGRDRAIDLALFMVNLLFVFGGAYWLARFAHGYGHNSLCGVLFLLAPAALVSLDRLTVDLALTALCIGFVLYVREERALEVYLILVLAALARETGMLLTAAFCLALLSAGRGKRALLFATSVVPAIAWYVFVQHHTVPYDSKDWFGIPLFGVALRMMHPAVYPFVPAVKYLAEILDEGALTGMVLAFVFAFWRQRWVSPPLVFAAMLLAASGLPLGKPFWGDVFDFGRVFSPLFVLIALESLPRASWLTMLPLALVDPRIGLHLAYKVFQVARSLAP